MDEQEPRLDLVRSMLKSVAPAPTELQLVETHVDTPPPVVEDEELPRRTKPRRRRGAQVENEPLMMVETQQPANAPQPPTPPTP